MFRSPFQDRILAHSRFLLVGMGGGYDVFTGLPLLFEIEAAQPGATVVLANVSFVENLTAKVATTTASRLRYGEVGFEALYSPEDNAGLFAEALGWPANYFPEYQLSKWFHTRHGSARPVVALSLYNTAPECGVSQLSATLQAIIDQNGIDMVILIDAGIDSVLVGDEAGVGTYEEDYLSLLALSRTTRVKGAMLMCVGMTTEGGINEYDFLENMAGIQRAGGYLGSVGWQREQASVAEYIDAISQCIPVNTSINSQIVGALQGHYGQVCPEPCRKRGLTARDMHLNPLMTIAYHFDVPTVIAQNRFFDKLLAASSRRDLVRRFEAARLEAGLVEKTRSGGAGAYCGVRTYRTLYGWMVNAPQK